MKSYKKIDNIKNNYKINKIIQKSYNNKLLKNNVIRISMNVKNNYKII